MFSAGILTSSMKIIPSNTRLIAWMPAEEGEGNIPVTDARRLNFPSILGALRPGVPFSMRKPRMSPWSSLAHTKNRSAIGCIDDSVTGWRAVQ